MTTTTTITTIATPSVVADNTGVNRSAILKAVKTIVLENRPVPTINDDQVLVKVMSTGICGSDIYHYNNPDAPHGMVLGHESAGQITQVGANVKMRHVGQKVAIEPGFLCKSCEFCRKGNSHVCANIRYAGNDGTDGTMSMWFACEPDMAVPMPDHISWEVAGCVQPVAISVQVARQAGIRPHQTLAVFGCGPLGLITMAVAKSYGVFKIIAFDIEPARVAFAKTYSADEAYTVPRDYGGKGSFQFANEFVKTILAEQGLIYGVDVSIDATGAEVCMQMAVIITKPHGTYLQAGFGKALTLMPMGLMAAKSISIKGTVRYGPGTFEDAIDLLAREKIDIAPLITATYPLSKMQDAIAAQIAREGIKIVLMNQE